MTETEGELQQMVRAIRADANAIQVRCNELLRAMADLQIKDRPTPTCPKCGVRVRFTHQLAEHMYHQHDGPEPEHWIEAERLSETLQAQVTKTPTQAE